MLSSSVGRPLSQTLGFLWALVPNAESVALVIYSNVKYERTQMLVLQRAMLGVLTPLTAYLKGFQVLKVEYLESNPKEVNLSYCVSICRVGSCR